MATLQQNSSFGLPPIDLGGILGIIGAITQNPIFLGLGGILSGLFDNQAITDASDANLKRNLGQADHIKELQDLISGSGVFNNAGIGGLFSFNGQTIGGGSLGTGSSPVSGPFGSTTAKSASLPPTLPFSQSSSAIRTFEGGPVAEKNPVPFSSVPTGSAFSNSIVSAQAAEAAGTPTELSDFFSSADTFKAGSSFTPLDLDTFRFDPDSINFPDVDAFRNERLGGIADTARLAQEQLRRDVVSGAGGPENAALALAEGKFTGGLSAGRAASQVESDIAQLLEGRAGLLAGLTGQNLNLLGNVAQFNAVTPINIAGQQATFEGNDQVRAFDAFFKSQILPALQGAGIDANLLVELENILSGIIGGTQEVVPLQAPILDSASNFLLGTQTIEAQD